MKAKKELKIKKQAKSGMSVSITLSEEQAEKINRIQKEYMIIGIYYTIEEVIEDMLQGLSISSMYDSEEEEEE